MPQGNYIPRGAQEKNVAFVGFDKFEKAMEKMPTKISRKVIIAAFRKGARPLISEARRNIKQYSPTLARSIGSIVGKSWVPTLWVGPRKTFARKGGKKSIKDDPWFAHFVEFGVSGIGRFKKGDKQGKKVRRYREDIAPRPFMGPAWATKKNECFKVIGDEMGKIIWRELEKNVPKG